MRQVGHLALGRAAYGPVLGLQRRLHERRRAGEVGDLLLSVEHDPVITLGRAASPAHLRAGREELDRLGVEVVAVERGGDVTYHGPGQLVLYPILDLRHFGRDLHRYVAGLEEVMICTAAAFGAAAGRRAGLPGVWVGERKLGSVGVHVRGWVTCHGLALNLQLEPNWFSLIVPCGLAGVEAVDVAEVTGRPVPWNRALSAAVTAFSDVFGVRVVPLAEEAVTSWAR
ncbi:MAG: lipoyl(octanoyl) transferase LipB [Candidatus Bipolaricaulaceae bacterium]